MDKYIFTTEKYHQMIVAGILTKNDPIELIQGDLLTKHPIGIRQASCVKRLNYVFSVSLSKEAIISIHNPIQLSDISEPEPDVALLVYHDDYYANGLPTAEDVYLVIEVSDTTLGFDRTVKLPMYAQAGIAEVWIVNLIDNAIELYREPVAGKYTVRMRMTRDKDITAVSFPHCRSNQLEI